MNTLTVLIPFFNEERTITELVRQLEAVPKGLLYECIFVDDGSTDTSHLLLSQALLDVHFKAKIISKANGGKASAIKEGAKALTSTHVVIFDSDLELATSDIEKLWNVVLAGEYDYVIGYRKFLSHSSFSYRFSRGNQLISNIYGVLFNQVITDILCGYKLVPSSILKSLKLENKNLELEITMQMWLRHQTPFEVNVAYRARTRQEGKTISALHGFTVIASMFVFRLSNKRVRI
jgi:glycosyltransferase involved in cell wall biosynthesis